MPRGGARKGSPTRTYANRVDLRDPLNQKTLPVAAPPSRSYGEKASMEASQRQLPMGGPADLPRVRPEPPGLHDPSQRPEEPVTSGAPVGPGPGPEALGAFNPNAPAPDPIEAELRELYLAYPTEELRELIEDWESR